MIRAFRERYPLIRFRIQDLSANEGLESVIRGEVEARHQLHGRLERRALFTPLIEDPFVLACRREDPLAARDRLTWRDLEGQPLIGVSRTSGNRLLLDAVLARTTLRLNWLYEVHHLTTSLGLVEAGLGASVLPRLATPAETHPVIVTRPIGDPVVTRTIGVVSGERPSLVAGPAVPRPAACRMIFDPKSDSSSIIAFDLPTASV